MNLPGDSIGISDILQYRACPQRFVFGMRRHVEIPERLRIEPGERDEPPESVNWTNAFGSAIHEAISAVEHGATHEAAIDLALQRYGTYLTPGDTAQLREDLELYEFRHPKGADLIAAERDMRVPLFVTDDGRQIYFRFKLDALFRLRDHPDVFLHRDYKSSAHRRTAEEVHSDPQMWAYNWGIHELWPECRLLYQEYDQLRFGVERTTKNAQQRADVKRWLIDMVKVILADDVLKPKINDFCRWCPMVVTCRETKRATAYWRGRLGILAPMRKDGRKVKLEFFAEGEELEEIIKDDLPKMQQARKHIEHVEKELKRLIEDMPLEDRERLGWLVRERHAKSITPDGLRELHGMLGDSFYELVNLPITRLEEFVGKPKKGEPLPAELQVARNWTVEEVGSTQLVAAKS